MKKSWLFLSIFVLSVLVLWCTKKEDTLELSLEKASICPEGFYWVDSAKSCIWGEELN